MKNGPWVRKDPTTTQKGGMSILDRVEIRDDRPSFLNFSFLIDDLPNGLVENLTYPKFLVHMTYSKLDKRLTIHSNFVGAIWAMMYLVVQIMRDDNPKFILSLAKGTIGQDIEELVAPTKHWVAETYREGTIQKYMLEVVRYIEGGGDDGRKPRRRIRRRVFRRKQQRWTKVLQGNNNNNEKGELF